MPAVGFIAHLDTSPDFSGKHVNPQIVENYRGGDIALGIGDEVLSPVMFPILHQMLGQTLITTDGKTLLGADDKAGIAEILTAMVRLRARKIPHGDIRVAFTPDEEVGRGTAVRRGGLQCRMGLHRGRRRRRRAGVRELQRRLGDNQNPRQQRAPRQRQGRDGQRAVAGHPHSSGAAGRRSAGDHRRLRGFYHLSSIKGSVERAEMHYILRDFEREGFEARKRKMVDIAREVGKGLPRDCYIEVSIEDSYYNMREQVAEHPHVIALAQQAMRDCDIEPVMKPIRGGTDGAQLSFRGLPCPNLFTGGYNYHGKHEFVTPEGMEQAVAVIMRIAALAAERAR